jgi:formate hydrogenlyase subunit 4
MYIWRVKALKGELRAGPMPPRRVLPYILGFAILLAIAAQLPLFLPFPQANKWDVVNCVGTVVLTFGGLWAAYRANGGPHGSDFAARLVALTWVVGWRLFPAFILLMLIAVVLAPEQFASDDAPTTPLLVAITLGYQLVFYWRLWVHLRDLISPVQGSAEAASASAAA